MILDDQRQRYLSKYTPLDTQSSLQRRSAPPSAIKDRRGKGAREDEAQGKKKEKKDVSHLGCSCCIVLADRCLSRACAMLSQHCLRRCVAAAGWPVGVSTFCQTPTILLFVCNRLCTPTVRPFPLCLPTLIRTLGPRCSFHSLVLILSPSSIVVASSRASRCNPRRAFPLRFSALWFSPAPLYADSSSFISLLALRQLIEFAHLSDESIALRNPCYRFIGLLDSWLVID